MSENHRRKQLVALGNQVCVVSTDHKVSVAVVLSTLVGSSGGKTDQSVYTNRTKYIRLTTTFHLTLMMTSAQVVETSVTITDNSPSQDYTLPDDQTTLLIFLPTFHYLSNY